MALLVAENAIVPDKTRLPAALSVRVPVAGPWITEREVGYVADAAANAWYSKANMYNERFETLFAQYVGTRFAATLPSCTSAIHLSLAALGVGPGDEVILPDVTWIASAAPVSYVGAQPVFADIDPVTWCIDAAAVELAITPRTKAIIAVDLYGGMPDMDALLAVAERHGIPVIEDAAEALGSEYKGRRSGSFGRTGVFSFHGSKTLTTGEGGMLVTDDEALFRRILCLRDHGRPPGDRMFENDEVAFKYKMSSMQAALGVGQIERVEELIARKREIFDWYRKHLDGVSGITLNAEPEGVKNSYWMVSVILDPALGLEKRALMAALSDCNIDSRPFFNPLTTLAAYRNHPGVSDAPARNPVGYRIAPWGVNLPSGFNLDEATVAAVCAVLRDILSRRTASATGSV